MPAACPAGHSGRVAQTAHGTRRAIRVESTGRGTMPLVGLVGPAHPVGWVRPRFAEGDHLVVAVSPVTTVEQDEELASPRTFPVEAGRRLVDWVAVTIFATVPLLLIRQVLNPLDDPDTYWHLRAGRYLLDTGSFSGPEPWSKYGGESFRPARVGGRSRLRLGFVHGRSPRSCCPSGTRPCVASGHPVLRGPKMGRDVGVVHRRRDRLDRSCRRLLGLRPQALQLPVPRGSRQRLVLDVGRQPGALVARPPELGVGMYPRVVDPRTDHRIGSHRWHVLGEPAGLASPALTCRRRAPFRRGSGLHPAPDPSSFWSPEG